MKKAIVMAQRAASLQRLEAERREHEERVAKLREQFSEAEIREMRSRWRYETFRFFALLRHRKER